MALPSLENKEKIVQGMFTSIAPRYDLNNTLLSFGLHHRWKRIAVDLAGVRPDEQVLDLCAGTADLTILLGKKVGKRGRVVALDLNESMLRLGRLKIIRAGLNSTVLSTAGNAHSLPFPSSSFDAVTVAFGIRNVTEVPSVLAEAFRVLVPGGRLVCLEFSVPNHPFIRKLYDFYSHYWMPWLASALSGDKTGTYRYLPDSIRAFYDTSSFQSMLVAGGFSEVQFRRLSLGIVTLHSGVKPVA